MQMLPHRNSLSIVLMLLRGMVPGRPHYTPSPCVALHFTRWEDAIGPDQAPTVLEFLTCLEKWALKRGDGEKLDRLDKTLKKEGLWKEGLPPPARLLRQMAEEALAAPAAVQHSPVFLQNVLVPILDEDQDGVR
jgi:hypothetical protein